MDICREEKRRQKEEIEKDQGQKEGDRRQVRRQRGALTSRWTDVRRGMSTAVQWQAERFKLEMACSVVQDDEGSRERDFSHFHLKLK